MSELSQIVCCPRCQGDMTARGKDICCSCGYSLRYKDGFFSIGNGADTDYARFYTKDYFNSSLYDYSSYRLARILGLVQPGKNKRVLDLGCGPGEIAARCAKQGAEVFGVDVSKDALQLSAERCKKEDVTVQLFEFDGERLPFKDATFDSIILSDVVEHVNDKTLSTLVKDCARLLSPDGWLVIHTSPTQNILALTQLMKMATFGLVDHHAQLVNPDYEYLHVRYHSPGSLRKILERFNLQPVIWGEFKYLSGTAISRWAETLRLRNYLADQLWCIAFADPKTAKTIRQDRPYLDMINASSTIDLGIYDGLCINDGFYEPELNSYRWTGQTASLFIEVPQGYSQIKIKLNAMNPDIASRPVKVGLYLAGRHVMELHLQDQAVTEVSGKIEERLKPGLTELKLVVDRTFVPRDQGMNEDARELGIAVYRIEIS